MKAGIALLIALPMLFITAGCEYVIGRRTYWRINRWIGNQIWDDR